MGEIQGNGINAQGKGYSPRHRGRPSFARMKPGKLMILQVKSAQSAWPLGRKEGGKTALWVSSEDTGRTQGQVEPWSLTEIWPQAMVLQSCDFICGLSVNVKSKRERWLCPGAQCSPSYQLHLSSFLWGTFSVTTCSGTAHGDCPKESLPTGLLCAHTKHLHTGASFLPARGSPSSRKDIT